MNRTELIIHAGALCVAASIWMLTSFPCVLLMLGIYILLFGLVKVIVDNY